MRTTILVGVAFGIGISAQVRDTRLPRFEDYHARESFAGTPAPPQLTTKLARSYQTQIRNGVTKGWGVEKSGLGERVPGPNFAGKMIVVQWSAGAPGLAMAMVDAKTGQVHFPPISVNGVGTMSFDLPLLRPILSVPRNPEVQFRPDSDLMIIGATPQQTEQALSYTYYFLWRGNYWTLLKRIPLG